jgi:predicted Zn-dependent protease
MNRRLTALAAALLASSALGACAYNETLGRNQLILGDMAAINQQSDAAWAELLRTQNPTRAGIQVERIRRVGDRLVQAAGLTDRAWDYAVFNSQSPNAFVLPSGKIGVTTGLLALVQNEDQLATVIGHEMGHVVAQHAAERASSAALANIGLTVAQSAAGSRADAVGSFGGVAAQYGLLLPHSRRDELEADRLGVDYMAAAGFRPSQAVALWRLMAQQRQSGQPEFASTHPSDTTRIQALEAYIDQRGWY